MTRTGSEADLAAIVDSAVEAYNALDFDRYARFFVEDLYFCHHNRGFEFTDRATFLDTLRHIAAELIPDRRLGAATRVTSAGNVLVREQTWGGTAVADLPGVAGAGETFTYDFCTVYVFDGERVREYHEYG